MVLLAIALTVPALAAGPLTLEERIDLYEPSTGGFPGSVAGPP